MGAGFTVQTCKLHTCGADRFHWEISRNPSALSRKSAQTASLCSILTSASAGSRPILRVMASSDSTYRPPTPSSGGRRTRLLGLLLTITLAAAFSAGAYAQQPAGIGDGAHRGYAAVRLSGGAPG